LVFSTISHAHAETVLRRISNCRFRPGVRLRLVFRYSGKTQAMGAVEDK
jgi:hypothetical protein